MRLPLAAPVSSRKAVVPFAELPTLDVGKDPELMAFLKSINSQTFAQRREAAEEEARSMNATWKALDAKGKLSEPGASSNRVEAKHASAQKKNASSRGGQGQYDYDTK